MSLPLPHYYDPNQVSSLYIERGGLVADAAFAYQQAHQIKPSSEDRLRIAAFGIDCQVGFCTPGASLFVPGAVEDTQRTIEWIYRNLDKLTSLYFSLDTHRVFQVFHPNWWRDREGRPPAPLTPITAADIRAGKWRAIARPEACLEYCEKLEESGKYVLTIWPYHTLLGGISHALVPSLMEAALFHSLVRQEQTVFEMKGEHPMTENYSVLSPEVQDLAGESIGCFNQQLYDALMKYDRVYVFGQAKSHCVLSTLQDLQDRIMATDPSLISKIWILEDAMSPVPAPPLDPLPDFLDFPTIGERAIARFREAGMKVVRTSDAV